MCPVHELTQAVATQLINAVSAANTAAATSTGFDLQGYIGEVLVVQQTGAITGTLDGKVQDCDTVGGTYADLPGTPNPGLVGAQVTTANQIRQVTIPVNNVRQFIRYLGTVATGPVLISVVVLGFKQYKP